MNTEKYDRIGVGYNDTRKADPYLVSKFISLLNPKSGGSFLDIGCGTGNYTSAFHEKNLNFIGMDPSVQMLTTARQNNPKGTWLSGSAEKTGLTSETMDGITGCLTIHHWQGLELAFKELYRVLKPEEKMVLFTSTPRQMQGYWLQEYFPQMLQDSMDQMPSLDNVTQALSQSGFETITTEKFFVSKVLEDLFLYSGKHRPHLYLDAAVRQGISSFSDLSKAEEITQGLGRLEADINSGAIQKIINSYENKDGDYLFVVASKEL